MSVQEANLDHFWLQLICNITNTTLCTVTARGLRSLLLCHAIAMDI